MPFLPDMGGGRTFPLVSCAPYSSPPGTICPLLTDDVIYGVGMKAKSGIFQLVVLLDSAADTINAAQDLADLFEVQTPYVDIHEATYLIIWQDRNE